MTGSYFWTMMLRASIVLVLCAVMLAGCERSQAGADRQGIDAGNPLEIAARERGIVRPDAAAPVGVFERSHDLGRDAMCVVPDDAGRWRFVVTASFGPELACTAAGSLTRNGAEWRMRFASREGCEVTVREEEDELRLPGDLPPACERLCPQRATLAGLRLPRASWAEDDAKRLQIRDRQGNMIRPCAS